MCILVVIRERVAGWPVVVGANRDEYRDRPWEPPRWDGDVLAPRDLRAGGSWIALHRDGFLVALTNRPEARPDPARPSRGLLVMDLARQGEVRAALGLLEEELARRRRNAFQVLLASA
ncbi:MAG: NRDE family protein, partial [Planctomycetota bacterium]